MSLRIRTSLAAFAGSAALLAAPLPAYSGAPESEWMEVFSPDGAISRALVPVRPQPPAAPQDVRADVVPIQQTGPSSERFDLVIVGDGYARADLGAYHEQAVRRWEELAAVEPFRSYRESFNVWQVNVVSAESGVDNDPTMGVRRDTALDMGFWCRGDDPNTERLLCVNETKARQFAALAPEAEQVLALGNSAKYGGAGGGIATSSGGNDRAGLIVVHELGHSVGGLADEYDYPEDTYTGPEPSEPNVSIHTREEIEQGRLKWHEYLGKPSPDGGVVGAFEGAYYHRRGVYRPTEDSVMRTLGKEFNLPGRDAMIRAFEAALPLRRPI
ncbi:M64 family metallopeptidase [Saccharopolyspora taberi]|uniref:M64 family metallopeptidase n=1 Tax=Saccharopolyspora taberi TaxID=60895 RepID=UPI0031CF423D